MWPEWSSLLQYLQFVVSHLCNGCGLLFSPDVLGWGVVSCSLAWTKMSCKFSFRRVHISPYMSVLVKLYGSVRGWTSYFLLFPWVYFPRVSRCQLEKRCQCLTWCLNLLLGVEESVCLLFLLLWLLLQRGTVGTPSWGSVCIELWHFCHNLLVLCIYVELEGVDCKGDSPWCDEGEMTCMTDNCESLSVCCIRWCKVYHLGLCELWCPKSSHVWRSVPPWIWLCGDMCLNVLGIDQGRLDHVTRVRIYRRYIWAIWLVVFCGCTQISFQSLQ